LIGPVVADFTLRSYGSAVVDEALKGPQQAPRAPGDPRQRQQPVRRSLTGLPSRELLLGDRSPALVDKLAGLSGSE
jgi:hypothetical protein